jgi:branched-chain amino acid transport system ATP-binding protein
MNQPANNPAPMLQATNLTRQYGGLKAVSDVSVDLHVGEVHAIIGTNGAGKSTLINMLSGEIPPSAGAVLMNGADITSWSQPRRARAGIGRSYQRTTIFPTFTLLENCRLAAQAAKQRPWAIWEAADQCKNSVHTAFEAMEAAGLSSIAHLTAGSMSHGQKRQLEIAMCLATRPKVLLLDEPLAGMGAEETERMLSILERLKSTHAILLVEHDMDAVFRVADRITVMVNGETIASDVPDAIRNNSAVQVAYLGDTHQH